MKKLILLPAIMVLLFACRREEAILPKVTPVLLTVVDTVKADTLADKSGFKVRLLRDSAACDEAAIIFNHKASSNYFINEDAQYFPGFGQGSLASISADNTDLAINCLPYISEMSIGLDVHAKTSGTFVLKISYLKEIPANIRVWLKDAKLKDSLDLRVGNYAFNINKSDTCSFGKHRFKIILRDNSQH